MPDLPTRTELVARWKAAAVAVPETDVSARIVDQEGSDLNLLANSDSIMGEEIVGRLARALAALFESTADAEKLDRLVFDRKGLTRLPAAPALMSSFELSRPTAGAGAGTVDGGPPGSIPAPTRVRTPAGIVYLLTEPAVFGALDLGPITVTGQAQLAGLANEVEAGQSWTFLDPPFDPTILISNPDPSAGAADEESDDRYRLRAKDFFATLRRGTRAAIELGLRSTPGVASVTVEEVLDLTGTPVAKVVAHVLDFLDRSNETLASRASLSLLEYRALGIPVQILAGVPQYVNIRYIPRFNTALVRNTSAALVDVNLAIVAALSTQAPDQNLERSTILAAIRSVPGVLVDPEDLIEPAGVLVPAATGNVFRTRTELIRSA